MKVIIELFYSPMCLYCPRAKKVLMEVADKFSDKVSIREVNVISPDGLKKAENYGIKGVPTIIIDGKTKITGVPKKERLSEAIRKLIERNDFHTDCRPFQYA